MLTALSHFCKFMTWKRYISPQVEHFLFYHTIVLTDSRHSVLSFVLFQRERKFLLEVNDIPINTRRHLFDWNFFCLPLTVFGNNRHNSVFIVIKILRFSTTEWSFFNVENGMMNKKYTLSPSHDSFLMVRVHYGMKKMSLH